MIEVRHLAHHRSAAPLPDRRRRLGSGAGDRRPVRLSIGAGAAFLSLTGAVTAGAGTAWAAGSTATPTTSPPTSPAANPAAGSRRPTAGDHITVSGVLKSIGKSSLAFKLADGTVATATLSSSTRYTKTIAIKASALKKGDLVTVSGATTNGVLAARRITLVPAGTLRRVGTGRPAPPNGSTPPRSFPSRFRSGAGGTGGFAFPAFGTVQQVSGNSFTLTEADKTTLKVTTTSTTAVTEIERTTKNGLTVGKTLSIRGVEKSNTVVAATSVSEGAPNGFGFAGAGPGGRFRTGKSGAPPGA